jgi:hypothetical protein
MKIIFLKLCLLLVVVFSGAQHPANKKIDVTGKALNAMGGAVVVVGANRDTYYLEGMDHWSRKFYGKKVRVTGTLVIIRTPTEDEKGRPQQVIPEQWLIKKPKWTLVN